VAAISARRGAHGAGLAYLQDCKHLTGVDLAATQVTDAGLAYLVSCSKLGSRA
jgi:hypothetical protein